MDEGIPPFSFVFLRISKKEKDEKIETLENKPWPIRTNFLCYIVGIDKTPKEFFPKENIKCVLMWSVKY